VIGNMPLPLFEEIHGRAVVAFRKFSPLGIRNEIAFEAAHPTAHTLACLRFAGRVTGTGARLATGSGGLTPGRAGFAPAGRRTKFHGVIASSIPLRPAVPGRTESLSIGEDCKTHFPIRSGFCDPGVCPRTGSATSSGEPADTQGDGRAHGSIGFTMASGSRRARRLLGCRVLHAAVGTILPSGPRSAIASFGSPEGHSLSVGPPGSLPGTSRNMDTHLRTGFASALLGDRDLPSRNRGLAYASRSAAMDFRYRSG
jgi:hypothetical protein